MMSEATTSNVKTTSVKIDDNITRSCVSGDVDV